MWVSLFLLAPAVLHHIPGAAEGRGQGEGTVSDGPPASTLRDAAGNELPARLFPASCTQPSPSSTYLIVPWHRRGLWQGRAPPSTTTFHQCLRAPSRSATTSACAGTHHSCAQRMLCWGSCQDHPKRLSPSLLPYMVTTAPVPPSTVSPTSPMNLDPAMHHLGAVMPPGVAVILPVGLHVSSLLCRHSAQAGLASPQALSSVTCHHH